MLTTVLGACAGVSQGKMSRGDDDFLQLATPQAISCQLHPVSMLRRWCYVTGRQAGPGGV